MGKVGGSRAGWGHLVYEVGKRLAARLMRGLGGRERGPMSKCREASCEKPLKKV